MIGYSDYGVGYLDPDKYDKGSQELQEDFNLEKAYLMDRRDDIEYFLSVAFENKSLKEDDLNEIFNREWYSPYQ